MQTYNGQSDDTLDHDRPITSFLLPNARTAGTTLSPTIQTSNMTQDQSFEIMLKSLQDDEIRRHQRSNNGQHGSNGDDPYANLHIGVFPVQGARPPNVNGPLDQSYVNRFSVENNTQNQSIHDPRQTTIPQGQSATNVQTGWKDETFDSFLRDMPRKEEDSSRHMMYTELIRLKTRSLELQIAEAQKRAKEAELELARWKDISSRRESQTRSQSIGRQLSDDVSGNGQGNMDFGFNSIGSVNSTINLPPQPFSSQPAQSIVDLNRSGVVHTAQTMNPPTPMTNLDFESLQAMTMDSNLENIFSFLEPFNTQSTSNQMGSLNQQTQSIQQNQQTNNTLDPNNMYFNNLDTPFFPPTDFSGTPAIPTQPIPSPTKRVASPSSDIEATSPPTKRHKRTTEKKVVVERLASCPGCQKSLGRIMFRAVKDRMPEDISIDLRCTSCANVAVPSILPDSTTSGASIGTVEMRKRLRATLELEDEENKQVVRRHWCDVCQRVVAAGRLVGGEKENLSQIAEIICTLCDAKYQRCTDCGGGGGPRVGIGKWRMKQVFPPGRKTCSLSHNRIGDRPRELGVHVTPTDFNPQQMKEVLSRTKGLWNEKTLARLAVPEMLEIDLPADVINPLTSYADVEDIVTRNWPTREAMIKAEGADSNRFKRLLGLIWAHPRSRRAVRTVDLENEEYVKTAEDEDDDMSTVLDNVKKTNLVIPPGSELVNMWGAEWDMQNGSLLISTLIPFEGADGDDNTALSVGEMITKVQTLRHSINQERILKARQHGQEPNLVPQCEHLWVVSGGTMPLVREKIAEVLIKKRSFVHVEEYLTRHPEFIHALKARPVGLHPDLHKPVLSVKDGKPGLEEIESRPLILVRWLGRDYDDEKVREIKLQEFGGKSKGKKKNSGMSKK